MCEPLPAAAVPHASAMRLHILSLALFVVTASAATIPDITVVKVKESQEAIKDVANEKPVENISSEQELIDQANVVKDVENNLRKGVQVADIPVKVVVEEVKPSLKVDSDKEKESNNEVPNEENIKRVEIDLKNPGEPQRTQHETQSPAIHDDEWPSLTGLIRQGIKDTTNVFNNGVQNFQQNLQSFWTNNQQYVQIQQNLQELQQNFQTQINKLNQTVQNYWPGQESNQVQSDTEAAVIKKTADSDLKSLQGNFKSGLESAAEGVRAAISRDGESPTATTPDQNFFQNFLTQISQQFNTGFQSMTTNFQNIVNQAQNNSGGNTTNILQNFGQGVQNLINQQGSNQPNASQSDENGSTSKPTIWQSFQNIFNPLGGQNNQGQQADTPVNQPNRPIIQAIQNNPIVQGVASVFQPNRPANKPEDKPQAQNPEPNKLESQKPEAQKPEAAQEGSNVVPATKPEDDKQKVKPEVVQYSQSGPIAQLLIERNPIVQGIAGAVQRIQHAVTNPEKPRDTKKEVEKGGEKEGEKGILVLGGHGHHHGGGSGDNSDVHSSGVAVRSEPVADKKEDLPKEPSKEEPAKEAKEEKAPEVPDKTE